jgi:heavy metal translocating P-type ATPase
VKTTSSSATSPCHLCGLPLSIRQVIQKSENGTDQLLFCCKGCHMVYHMLMAAADIGDSTAFKKSDLFKRCQDAGIIPGSKEDLRRQTFSKEISSSKALDSDQKTDSKESHLTLELVVNGMWCPACAWVIDESLHRIDGVISSQCFFAIDRLKCIYNPLRTSPFQIQKSIKNLGYTTHELDSEKKGAKINPELVRLLISAFLGMNVMMFSFALYVGFFSELSGDSVRKLSWPIFFLATCVVSYGGWPIFYKALTQIKSRALGMEVLISIGTLCAFGYSCYNFSMKSIHLYFDTASMLIVLTLLGKAVEEQAKKKVRKTIDHFFTLIPKKVCLITSKYPSGRYVRIAQLQVGDLFKVQADEIMAADGIVISGRAQVDESALSGEARPVAVSAGTFLKSGCRLIIGSIVVKVTAVGSDATLGQMISVIQRNLHQKTPFENQTDRALRYFTPAIIILSFGTAIFCLWACHSLEIALVRAVTVMVVACPCALGIAVPMARVAGVALAARNGILVHEVNAFEQANEVDTIVFDKTGTLTYGQWRLTKVEAKRGYERDFILQMAAGLEQKSKHFIATEIHREVTQEGLTPFIVENPTSHTSGVTGRYQGKLYRLGSRRFVKAPSDIPCKAGNTVSVLGPDLSRVFLSADEKVIATLLFSDHLRTSTIKTIKHLVDQNMHIKLVTGDGESTARQVASKIGIKEVHTNMLPLEKASLISALKTSGHKVAMVGDGINDAPALSRADLSVAMATANPLTDHITHITLMGAKPSQLATFFDLARQVTRKIKQNLWCALIYNLVSIPLAMIGWISPLVAVSAMLMSSLTVTVNTFLLTYIKNHKDLTD